MTQPGDKVHPYRFEEIVGEVLRREGSELIYRETGLIAHARISELCLDPRRVTGTATIIYPPAADRSASTGSTRVMHDSWQFGCGWGWFGLCSWGWSVCYAGWTLYFDAGLIRDLSELGLRSVERMFSNSRGAEGDPLWKEKYDRFHRLADRISRHHRQMKREFGGWRRISKPG